MTEQSTIQFYNNESSQYSKKRYEGVTETYTQFFFKKRLSFVLDFLQSIITLEGNKLEVLEVGCADGVIVDYIKKSFPNSFAGIVGIDIAENMIKVAQEKHGDASTTFYVRGEEPQRKYDVILAVGFLNMPMLKNDFDYLENNLKEGGYFIWSVASKGSLHARIKLRGVSYLKDYYTFKEYEDFISSNFEIVKGEPYGFFVPKLWAFPRVARVLQPIVESVTRYLFQSLFHEKIYLLKKKTF